MQSLTEAEGEAMVGGERTYGRQHLSLGGKVERLAPDEGFLVVPPRSRLF